MKRFFSLTLASLLFAGASFAQSNVASQQVAINVAEISVIAVHGNISMTINSAVAGQAPDPATASGTFDITTNGKKQKITAELDSKMPTGLSLYATMAAPNGAESEGKVELSDKSVDLLKDISQVRASGLSLSYEAVATVDASPDNVVRTVTYTITKN